MESRVTTALVLAKSLVVTEQTEFLQTAKKTLKMIIIGFQGT